MSRFRRESWHRVTIEAERWVSGSLIVSYFHFCLILHIKKLSLFFFFLRERSSVGGRGSEKGRRKILSRLHTRHRLNLTTLRS